MRPRLLLTAGLAFAPAVTLAQDTQPIVLRAARMLDVTAGRMLTNAVVVVQGDKIAAVNPATLPSGHRTIDLHSAIHRPRVHDDGIWRCTLEALRG